MSRERRDNVYYVNFIGEASLPTETEVALPEAHLIELLSGIPLTGVRPEEFCAFTFAGSARAANAVAETNLQQEKSFKAHSH